MQMLKRALKTAKGFYEPKKMCKLGFKSAISCVIKAENFKQNCAKKVDGPAGEAGHPDATDLTRDNSPRES